MTEARIDYKENCSIFQDASGRTTPLSLSTGSSFGQTGAESAVLTASGEKTAEQAITENYDALNDILLGY